MLAVPSVDVSGVWDTFVAWLEAHGLLLLVVVAGLLVCDRVRRPRLHGLIVRLFTAQAAARPGQTETAIETEKRIETVEDLVAKLLRFGVVLALILVIFAAFDLWPLIAGLGIVAAAITLAGQSIVLDYLMGVLILVEGQYFKGDIIVVTGIEGTVEEVGLRRTVIRDNRGIVHSISNGLIRQSSNMTRTYAIAMVFIEGIPEADVDRAIEVLDQVGRDFRVDEQWKDRVFEAPRYSGTTALTATGATLRMTGKVRPDARQPAEQELRRRVAMAIAAAEIEPNRPVLGAGTTGG